ncbi:hypothetical protein FACS189426_06400 [Bacteroidia bacterium]|nr:hypothetical protein FACS189426_06400 [Bacteroidia bacterium]
METNKIYNCDNRDLMKEIPDESINVILTDPPYLYLKNQKLERKFDENLFFSECKRILKKDGFIVLFGRGTSFYRWNTILVDLGFNFKEEIIWNKSRCSSPLLNISRVHETISIHTKNKGKINKVKVPYLEMKGNDIDSICIDLKRFLSGIKNEKSLNAVLDFLKNNQIITDDTKQTITRTDRYFCDNFTKYRVTSDERKSGDRAVNTIQSIFYGMNEKSIIRTDFLEKCKNKHHLRGDMKDGDRAINTLNSIYSGMNEKDIIKIAGEHYASIHPTQKPARLLERLLALTSKEGDIILDPFAGSCSTAIGCINSNRQYICCEIDEQYYTDACKRVLEHL